MDFESDFQPVIKQGNVQVPNDVRVLKAAEYSAYQLGQIKQALRRIADAMERREG